MSLTKNKVQFWMYRLATVCKSFKELYTLSPEKMEAFLDSYCIYDYDWTDEKAMIAKFGPNYYNEIKKRLASWYSVLNHLCAIGQVEKMYIPPAIDLSKSIIENQTLFEERMARDLKVGKGNKVLDIGCGRGRVASHIASFTGAHVTGINIDKTQIDSAQRYTHSNGLSGQCQFMLADVNDLPFPFESHSLDAIYHVQVFSIAKDWPKLFKELYRMLKPGGRFACLDWAQLDKYDAKNAHHADLMRRIKPLIGAIGTHTVKEYEDFLKEAGFDILTSENASIDALQAPLIEKADKFYTRMTKVIKGLVKCKILPSHFSAMFDRFTQDGEAFVEADRMRLVTTSHYIVAQKK